MDLTGARPLPPALHSIGRDAAPADMKCPSPGYPDHVADLTTSGDAMAHRPGHHPHVEFEQRLVWTIRHRVVAADSAATAVRAAHTPCRKGERPPRQSPASA